MSGPKVTLYLSLTEAAALVEHLTGEASDPPLADLNSAAAQDRRLHLWQVARKAQRELSFIYRRRRARRES